MTGRAIEVNDERVRLLREPRLGAATLLDQFFVHRRATVQHRYERREVHRCIRLPAQHVHRRAAKLYLLLPQRQVRLRGLLLACLSLLAALGLDVGGLAELLGQWVELADPLVGLLHLFGVLGVLGLLTISSIGRCKRHHVLVNQIIIARSDPPHLLHPHQRPAYPCDGMRDVF